MANKWKKRATAFNEHHIIWRCNSSWANVEHTTNKMLVSVLKHDALNRLMNDRQHPQEQLKVMYDQWWKPVLSKKVCEEIEHLLTTPKEDFYDSEFIR